MAKIFGDTRSFAAADRCMEIHGGIGLTTDLPIEKFWRNQRSFMITEGPIEILKMTLARHVLRIGGFGLCKPINYKPEEGAMADYKYENVKVEIKDGIGWAILNRPEKRNAMSPQLHYDMDDALATTGGRRRRQGGGGHRRRRQFQRRAGSESVLPRARKQAARAQARRRGGQPLALGAALQYDKPTIAMVHGYCVGGAFMQLLASDFAIAAEEATFSLSEVNWGILPGALVSKVVADMVLPRHALYYACLGKPFDGKEAARIGMVNFAVPPAKLEQATIELAQELMKKSPNALRATKQAIRHVRTMDVEQAYDYLVDKGKAIQVGDQEDSYNTGLRQFLDEKSYKPTYEPFRLRGDKADASAEKK